MMGRALVFGSMVAAGCEGRRAPVATPDPAPTQTTSSKPAPAPPPANGKWDCSADADCMNSCSQGAVSAKWYAGADVKECKDGCANQVSAPPRCIDGGCVAFQRDPQDGTITRSEPCTRKQ